MKKILFYFTFVAALCFYSCSNDDDDVDNGIDLQAGNPIKTKLLKERLSMNEPSISNPKLHDDWENVNVIYLNGSRKGQYVDAPWTNLGGNSIDIPLSYRMDIKKEDGWSMLTHNIMDIDYSGPNYILLYNKKRGELKGFYYNPSYEKNKSCVWVMEVQNDGVTSIFASNKKNDNLMNKKYHVMTTSNIIENDTFSFGQLSPGWNAFSFELFYGTEDNAPIVKIYGYFDEQNEIKMAGKYSGEVTIPITKTDPSGASKLLSAVKGITKIIPGGSSLSSVISFSGAVLGHTSAFKSKTSVYHIRATSSGSTELAGMSMAQGRGTIPSINNIDLKKANKNEDLGLWNFAKNPTFSHSSVIYVQPMINTWWGSDIYMGNLDAEIANLSDLIIAPQVKPLIKKYSVCSRQFFYERDGTEHPFENEKIADDLYFTQLNYIKGGEHYPLDKYHMYFFIAHCPSTKDLYVNLTVHFEFNDGSEFTSSRNFKADFICKSSSKELESMEKHGVIVIWI